MLVARLVFFWSKGPAIPGTDTKDLKEARCYDPGPESFRLLLARKVMAVRLGRRHLRAHLTLALPIDEVCWRRAVLFRAAPGVLLPQGDDSIGILVGQWAQEHTIDHTKDGGIRADAQGQCDNGRSCKTGFFHQHARPVAQV